MKAGPSVLVQYAITLLDAHTKRAFEYESLQNKTHISGMLLKDSGVDLLTL